MDRKNRKRPTLIIHYELFGHFAEYFHNLWMGAIERPDEDFIFTFPKADWEQVKKAFDWPEAPNIEVLEIDNIVVEGLKKRKGLSKSVFFSKWIKKVALKVDAKEVIVLNIALGVPVLPIILPKRIKLSGIIYKIFFYTKQRFLNKIVNHLKYSIVKTCLCSKNIFILNDASSSKRFNNLFRTDKFKFLPDPVPSFNQSFCKDLRPDLNIDKDNMVFLHFGALNERKGTIIILEAIKLLSKKIISGSTFIFAGKVNESIKNDFYNIVRDLKESNANIIIIDKYVDEDYLHMLCHTSDCILAPYTLTSLSSGVIGWAAVHDTPILGPGRGLIGELIRTNNLGITLNDIDPFSVAGAIETFKKQPISRVYVQTNTVKAFNDTILGI